MSRNRRFFDFCRYPVGLHNLRTAVEDKPIKSLDIISVENGENPHSPIPRRKRAEAQSNGHVSKDSSSLNGNGISSSSINLENGTSGKKRSAIEAFEDDLSNPKRSKVDLNGTDNGVIVVDDAADGAILIDDD